MNKYKFLLTAFLFTGALHSIGQTRAHLKLSNKTPEAGATVSFRYDPEGTNLQRKEVKAAVYFFDNDKFPVIDVDLRKDGRLILGKFKIPVGAKAFCVQFTAGNLQDDNNQSGYVYLAYKNKKPVNGSFASKGYIIGLAADMFGIKKNMVNAAVEYKKEFKINPLLEREYEPLYLLTLYYATSADQDLANNIALKLSTSANEDDLTNAYNYFRHAKKSKLADSLASLIKKRFPKGNLVKSELEATFTQTDNVVRKDSLFQVFCSLRPANKSNTTPDLDRLLGQLAVAYLQAHRITDYHQKLALINDKSNLPEQINEVLANWANKGSNIEDAILIAKQNLILLDSLSKHAKSQPFLSPGMQQEANRSTYFDCLDTYALLLFNKGKWDEASDFERQVYNYSRNYGRLEITEHYARMLNKVGNYESAKSAIERLIKSGDNSPALGEELKVAYAHLKGNLNDFDKYLDSLVNFVKTEKLEELSKKQINIPAPEFRLKDQEGRLISLSDLKGKVVVLDFWATWCAPCKASFPGMQIAIDKFKDNKDVVFLFVDTWESGTRFVEEAAKFMKDNKFSFQVLFDEKGPDGRMSKIRSLYGVDGVPTKFIIDKTGRIRFKVTGFTGSSEALVEEIQDMIAISNKDS
ncbi:TlpA disulfide reductase family protein [Mucilaginibacter sp. SG564]|uniref:TlpA disulfide reductase family protein n=1 Tax=Mucilaginibacter sp. SG564 TaxID=2587022 RepID=UPI0015574370|nr:TlpA disulfide reductase family protein [Mucilaginibacter sp. SG564]NOW95027.1 peroxiredoxin [Mucilaginibacter sp. SG564]